MVIKQILSIGVSVSVLFLYSSAHAQMYKIDNPASSINNPAQLMSDPKPVPLPTKAIPEPKATIEAAPEHKLQKNQTKPEILQKQYSSGKSEPM